MSRFGDADDTYHDDPPPPDDTCSDCGIDYSKGEHDPTTWCDECSNKRDQHTSALELRMAKADLDARATRLAIA